MTATISTGDCLLNDVVKFYKQGNKKYQQNYFLKLWLDTLVDLHDHTVNLQPIKL